MVERRVSEVLKPVMAVELVEKGNMRPQSGIPLACVAITTLFRAGQFELVLCIDNAESTASRK